MENEKQNFGFKIAVIKADKTKKLTRIMSEAAFSLLDHFKITNHYERLLYMEKAFELGLEVARKTKEETGITSMQEFPSIDNEKGLIQ